MNIIVQRSYQLIKGLLSLLATGDTVLQHRPRCVNLRVKHARLKKEVVRQGWMT